MTKNTPIDLMERLDKARLEGDMDGVVTCYESNAMVVVEPGKMLSGVDVIRAFNKGAGDLGIRFSDRFIIEGAGVALHYRSWMREDNTTGEIIQLSGVTTDILRQQQDGAWLISVDNPWGIDVVQKA